MLKPPAGYDLCGQVSQFHVYLLHINACLVQILNCESSCSPFQQGEGRSWGLLRTQRNASVM